MVRAKGTSLKKKKGGKDRWRSQKKNRTSKHLVVEEKRGSP